MSWSQKQSALEVPSVELFDHRRTVQSIVAGFELKPSSRILVAGDPPQGISDYLEFLGIDVVPQSEVPEKSSTLGEIVPSPALDEKTFDAAIVFFDTSSSRSLFCPQALQSTASRLRLLRPEGHFAFALDFPNRTDKVRINRVHCEECFVKLLSCFPGKISHGRPKNGLLSLRKSESQRYSFLSLKVPDAATYPRSWYEFVKPALGIHPEECCEFARTVASHGQDWKRAA